MTITTTVCAYCGLVQQVEFIAFDRSLTGCFVCPECRCLYKLAGKEAKEGIMTSIIVHQGTLIKREE
ncbi:MAG: hypothetical protein IMZ61_03230 [Planctomycetes bacterium]|nr:hypothetical protein [Planctomycetota bacterium]